jgi:plastocyanin domain-containing protein
MPKYGISKSLRAGENIITFTPTQTGEIPFSCSMGMYRGKFIVVDSGSVSKSVNGVSVVNAAELPPTGSVGGCGGCGGGGGGCGGGKRKPLETKIGTVTAEPVVTELAEPLVSEQVIKSVYTHNDDIVPNTFTVKKGQPVKYIVDVKENGSGCMSTILIPGLYDIPELLVAGQQIVMTFTPQNIGDYQITCAMGVPRGLLKVVN